ncbi:MAG: hypothetical protein WBJ82_03135 [Tepidanaerobacteraceae bacterium]|nr:hypothetical protein [Tepidanaerobacter sp.]HQA59728.1 hypothetical protein [Tepidanaerobacteraceae bacterium]HQE05543.1 hypothetical protein [Tepidanaerobacteraceae bacterium]
MKLKKTNQATVTPDSASSPSPLPNPYTLFLILILLINSFGGINNIFGNIKNILKGKRRYKDEDIFHFGK